MVSGSLQEMQKHSALLTQKASDDCGCPEEEWEIDAFFVVIHLEPDSRGHIFIDGGDCGEDERLVDCDGIEDLRAKAAEWIYSMPVDNNL